MSMTDTARDALSDLHDSIMRQAGESGDDAFVRDLRLNAASLVSRAILVLDEARVILAGADMSERAAKLRGEA